MALVVNQSKDDVTVIILDDNGRTGEAEALTRIFAKYGRLMPELDELANALTSLPYESDDIDADAPVDEAIVREVKNQGMADWLGVKRG